jgi:hypothetical protein
MLFLFAIPHVAAAPSAVIQNDSAFISSLGWYNIVGEVKNTGNVTLQYIYATATLKDSAGIVVDSVQGAATVTYLPPNEKAPFEITDSDPAKSARVASYTLRLSYAPIDTNPHPFNLIVQNVGSSKNNLGWLEIVGEVNNTGSSNSEFTRVIGTFYDSQGKVVDTGYTFTSPPTIGRASAGHSNNTNSFKLTVTDKGQIPKITTWALIAESDQYTSLPEFPWPIIALATVLSFAVIAMRRINLKGAGQVDRT